MKKGDYIVHKVFGLCRIIMISELSGRQYISEVKMVSSNAPIFTWYDIKRSKLFRKPTNAELLAFKFGKFLN